MKIKLALGVLALTTITCLSGCSSTKTEEEKLPPVVLEDTSNPYMTIIYNGENEYSVIKILDKNMDLTGRVPRAIVRLKNIYTLKLPIEYQCEWTDEFGAPIGSRAAWQRLTIPQNGEKVIVDLGKSTESRHVTIHLRFPEEVKIWVPYPDPATAVAEYENANN